HGTGLKSPLQIRRQCTRIGGCRCGGRFCVFSLRGCKGTSTLAGAAEMETPDGELVTASLAQICDWIQEAVAGCRSSPFAIASLNRALLAVESLSLAEPDFTRNRLIKARRYLQCGECGAAEFELTLAARNLKRIAAS